MNQAPKDMPSKEKLIEILKKVLKTDQDLSFLSTLSQEDLKILVGCIREKVEHFSGVGQKH